MGCIVWRQRVGDVSIMVITTNEGKDNLQDWGWPGGGEGE